MRRNAFYFLPLNVVVISIFLSAMTAYAAQEVDTRGQKTQSDQITNPGVRKGFNPQPEPPGRGFANPGVRKGFDPQPEPPGRGPINPGVIKGFDPQPEPPGRGPTNPAVIKAFNPQPEPPGDVNPNPDELVETSD